MTRSTRVLALLGVALAAVTVGRFALAHGGSDRTPEPGSPGFTAAAPSTSVSAHYGKTIAVTGVTAVSQYAAADALCAIRPVSVSKLTKISTKASALENLRDGLPLLHDQISEVQLAAQGRASLTPVLHRLNRLYGEWSTALTAHDAGRDATARTAMTAAKKQVVALSADLDAAFPDHTKDCQA